MKVMVIDDSAVALELAKNAIEGLGHAVVTIDTPLGASIVAGLEKPDLVLVDVSMASMSGETLVKNMKRSKLPGRIVLFSDRPEPELKAAAGRCGADGWIRKSDSAGIAAAVNRG